MNSRLLGIQRVRSGFTLLEIVLSIGLMLVLVVAISQSITTYVELSTLGREEVQQAQIGRATLQQIARDIRAVMFTPIAEEDLPIDDFGSEEVAAEDDDFAIDDIGTSSEDEQAPSGIIGTSRDLIIFARIPNRKREYVAREEMTSPKDRVSDARVVQYFLAESGGPDLSGAFAREALGPGVVKDVVGLGRMEGDQISLITALEEGQLETQVECCQLLAREVIKLEFAYYSGGEWLDEWDSFEENKLPQAIEVKISVQLQPEEDLSRFQRVDQESETETVIRKYKRIIAIPLVPPVEIEEEEAL